MRRTLSHLHHLQQGFSIRRALWAVSRDSTWAALLAGEDLAVGKSVTLLQPPLSLVRVSIGMGRECQQNHSHMQPSGCRSLSLQYAFQ